MLRTTSALHTMSKLKAGGGMSSVSVKSGLGPGSLKDGNLILIGHKAHVQNLKYAELQAKFAGLVSEADFQAAQALLSTSDAVNLRFNACKLVGLPGKVARHESPAEPQLVTRHVRSLLNGGAKGGSVVLVVKRERLVASVAAVARAFPLFSTKTGRSDVSSVSIELLPPDGSVSEKETAFLDQLARSVREAAALVDMPCSVMNTDAMVAEAEAVAAEVGAKVTVIRGEELKSGGFGGLYSVGRAALFPPALVVLSHMPAGADKTLALVGKGIVYDTGGMQIKGKTAMPGMKRDMGGSAAVLMGFRAAVLGGCKHNLHCLLCLAENNIGAIATKPDDIITMLSGKTVEVNNTDAEGRLVLGDGVFYAKTVLKADTILDFATLTGAQNTATGGLHAALVSNSDAWEGKAVRAGRHSGDLTHPLTFAPNLHFDILSSAVADMKVETRKVHCGERATGYGPPLIAALLAEDLSGDVKELLLH